MDAPTNGLLAPPFVQKRHLLWRQRAADGVAGIPAFSSPTAVMERPLMQVPGRVGGWKTPKVIKITPFWSFWSFWSPDFNFCTHT